MKGIADNDGGALGLQARADAGKPLLIAPTEIGLIVPNEAIIVVSDGVRGIAVYEIVRSSGR
jgi:hypothetical protein